MDKHVSISDKAGLLSLVLACEHFGVKDVVICPGSRNAPLILSFNRCLLFNCHSIVDERSAGFYALGMSLASGKPAVVICTSGSAVANLAPAMVEAFYQKLPLIAITADRPLVWTDQGNGQTIRQEHIFENFSQIGFSLISEPQTSDESWFNYRKLSEAFNLATAKSRGPIHINVPLAEPLYGIKEYRISDERSFYKTVLKKNFLRSVDMENYRQSFSTARKVMILAGSMCPNARLEEILSKLAERSNVAILNETTANLHLSKAIDTIDRIFMPLEQSKTLTHFLPDLLITIGGYVVSKKIKALLRKHKIKHHWHIHPFDEGIDTYQNLTDEISVDASEFFEELSSASDDQISTYGSSWAAVKKKAQEAHQDYIPTLEFSDFYAFAEIFKQLPMPGTLHLSNSSPVRYMQLFGHLKGVAQFANRGTSGIDGCTSTAAGFARVQPERQHFLITGDIGFLYDSNALWNEFFPHNLKIIVINNGGGGIFRLIEGPDATDELETFFEANHPADIKKLSESYGFQHFLADHEAAIQTALPKFLNSRGKVLMEICTPKEKNAAMLKNYFAFIGNKIEPGQKESSLV